MLQLPLPRFARFRWEALRVWIGLLLVMLAGAAERPLAAQGLTTAGVRGVVRGVDRLPVEIANIRVVNHTTGFTVEVEARYGYFVVHGLEPGGPYSVTARSLGLRPERRTEIFLQLGELRQIEFALERTVGQLETVRVDAVGSEARAGRHGGIATLIADSVLHRLPTLNRDLYDFVRLVPQISTKISLPNPGISAAGTGFRFNNFLINGVSERTISGGVSNAFAGARSVPLEAVREYQVLIAPYDVRYGDFAGALVNTVTRSGGNDWQGSLFTSARNDRLRRSSAGESEYQRFQYGMALSGPLVKDRVHFFIAPEFQRFRSPAPGPWVGQPPGSGRSVPVSDSDLVRMETVLAAYGLHAGTAGLVENGNPLRNSFSRIDMALPFRSRAVIWNNYGGSDDIVFSRESIEAFPFSTYQLTRRARTSTTALHLHTHLRGGMHNELLISARSEALTNLAPVAQPVVRVIAPAVGGGRVTLVAGTHESAHGVAIASRAFSFRENLTIPLAESHEMLVGLEAERVGIMRRGVIGGYGSWSFASLDSLEAGIASRYDLAVDHGNASVPLRAWQYGAYVADHWRAGSRVTITAGIRADMIAIEGRAPYHAGVDSIFARRTDRMPRRRVELSPRLGFTADLTGRGAHRLRGGAGIFTGRYPLAWAHTALSSYGIGGSLRCGPIPSDLGPAPAFDPNYSAPPQSCANGVGVTTHERGDVNLLSDNLRMARALRSSLAYDFLLRADLEFGLEALVTRMLSDFVFLNLNLREPQSTDRNGRVMYGTIAPSGASVPSLRSSPAFAEVIELGNTPNNRSYQLVARLQKSFARQASGMMSYTFTRARDTQTPVRVNTRGTVAWAGARVLSGRQDDLAAGISANDIPHRVVVAGTSRLRHGRAPTDVAFHYVGESGRPFTYTSWGVLRLGDLNADGTTGNDPIYVPVSALDENEIRFSGISSEHGADNSETVQAARIAARQVAFERFIESSSCLRRQRGRILERNSCREPWSGVTVASVRQSIPVQRRTLELELQVFNVLNLINRDWGLRREAVTPLLEHVAHTNEPVQAAHAVFRFNPDQARWTTAPIESAFQMQLAARYVF